MKCLYIGQCEEGSTSNMRFVILRELLNCEIELINLTPIIINSPKILRSLGWRYKIGPMMTDINTQITRAIHYDYDMIWIDKGVFINPKILKIIRNRTKKLIHFTPDPAFFYHKSRYFRSSLPQYDFCITTKSFELDEYIRYGCQNLIYCTQGYDEIIHQPQNTFEEKEFEDKIKKKIRTNCSPRHIPSKIIVCPDIPRTKSNKIVEVAVRKIINGDKIDNFEALANPESLEFFKKLKIDN